MTSPARLTVWCTSMGKWLPEGHGLLDELDPGVKTIKDLPGEARLTLHLPLLLLSSVLSTALQGVKGHTTY